MPIRHKVLWPSKPVEFCHVAGDENAYHVGVVINDALISVASIYFDNDSARLRKFATLENFQGQGFGSKLILQILSTLKDKGIRYLWCDARESATGFYDKLGFKVDGDKFYKSGVAYFKMSTLILRG